MALAEASWPSVSVFVTSYNYARFVGRAVRSALDQGYPQLEVVVVDDASSDDSVTVLEALARADSRVKLTVNPKNLGAVGNFNRALGLCQGEYVCFLSADNVMLPGHLLAAVDYLRRSGDALRSTGWYELDDDGLPSGVRVLDPMRNLASHSKRRKLEDIFSFGDFTLGESIVFPRALFQKHGEMSFKEMGDLELLARFASSGIEYAYDGTPRFGFYYHDRGIGARANYLGTGAQLRGWVEICRRYLTLEVMRRLVGRGLRVASLHRAIVDGVRSENPTGASQIVAALAGELMEVEERIRAIPRRLKASEVVGPRFSVIVPSVSRLGALRRSLGSVVAQTTGSWEIVLVQNDGIDNAAFVSALPYRDRIVYARTADTWNAAAARNVGLRLASGESIAYLDEGDLWEPNHLEVVGRALDAGADVVRTGALAVHVDDTTEAAWEITDRAFFRSGRRPFVDPLGMYAPLCALAHRRACSEEVGPFDEGFAVFEVWEFFTRMIVKGGYDCAQPEEITARASFPRSRSVRELRDERARVEREVASLFARFPTDDATLARRRKARSAALVEAAAALPEAESLADFVSVMRTLRGDDAK